MHSTAPIHYDAHQKRLICQGVWNLQQLPALQKILATLSWPQANTLTIDGQGIETLDSAGAWVLASLELTLTKQSVTIVWSHFSAMHTTLLELVKKNVAFIQIPSVVKSPHGLTQVGIQTIKQLQACLKYFAFIGHLTETLRYLLKRPERWRLHETMAVIFRTGYQALPIIAILSFMIGVVITYQLGLQLRTYGANNYIVNLLGLAILREFGPLITAIMVAGRTGSAFTAQLGMMKVNQEIDALNTMGITPAELLLLPRIIGLFIALPLLTFWADIFGVFGGMIMSNNMLQISWYEFVHRFPHVIPLKTLFIGLGKAPLFALIIASIGCFQGMQVTGNVNNIGLNTTRSVVLSIFFIIVVDALLSILFSKLKL